MYIERWQADAWNALYNAAQVKYYAEQQDIAARITAIEDKLANVDTLTLRREESDEIMKNVLKFVLGPRLRLHARCGPEGVRGGGADLVMASPSRSVTGKLSVTGQVRHNQWTVLRQHEDIVRFINQAIEWENVVTFPLLLFLGLARKLGIYPRTAAPRRDEAGVFARRQRPGRTDRA